MSDLQASQRSREASPNSVSFVVTTENGVRHSGPILEVLKAACRDGDEVLLLTRDDRTHELPICAGAWLRVVGIPDGSVFTLRSHIPAVCRKEWVVLLEEHALITAATLDAIRDLMQKHPTADLIPFLGKNLTSVTPWGWTNFLHTFALVWAPLGHPPPFALVTATIVRRARLATTAPLREGEWEMRVIPRVFSDGEVAYSNQIYVDHFKPLNLVSCLAINFHNARVCAAVLRTLGESRRDLIRTGLHVFTRRPGELALALEPRRHELPPGTFTRLRVVGLAHMVGHWVGAFLGPGRSAHHLD